MVFFNNQSRWSWAPAFAGATKRDDTLLSITP
jgi:hypothetical protein